MPIVKTEGLRRRSSAPRWALPAVIAALVIGGAPLACSLATQGNEYGQPAASGAGTTSASSSSSGSSGEGGGQGGGSSGQGGAVSASSSGSASSTSSGAGGGGVACPSGMGPTMVVVPPSASTGMKSYCIDSTEVTVSQYRDWVGSDPSVSNEEAFCNSWNKDHFTKGGGDCDFYNIDVINTFTPHHPIGCVNWCDAYAYCKAAGKRLCGGVGGGANVFVDTTTSTKGQWYIACSAADSKTYPYGNSYDGKACATSDYEPVINVVKDVGDTSGCEGGYPGIYDMSGNVSEWEDACEAQDGASDLCYDRSGSYRWGEGENSCSYTFVDSRESAYVDVGFRCCADLP